MKQARQRLVRLLFWWRTNPDGSSRRLGDVVLSAQAACAETGYNPEPCGSITSWATRR
jgi:hypothetical protein